MRSLAIMSEKGGTGKTTTTVNIASAIARKHKLVLLVDADSQGNASFVFSQGRKPHAPTLSHVLLGQASAADAIRSTHVQGVAMLPADHTLAEANVALAGELGRERRLSVALADVASNYDFVLVDTSPARSLLSVNVMNFVEAVLVTVDPGLFSLTGLDQLQAAVGQVRRYLDNRELRIAGLLLTRTGKNNLTRDIEAQLRSMFGPLVLSTTIPSSVKVEEAHSRFQSVLDYAGRTAAAKAYMAATEEILARLLETLKHDDAETQRPGYFVGQHLPAVGGDAAA